MGLKVAEWKDVETPVPLHSNCIETMSLAKAKVGSGDGKVDIRFSRRQLRPGAFCQEFQVSINADTDTRKNISVRPNSPSGHKIHLVISGLDRESDKIARNVVIKDKFNSVASRNRAD